MPGQTIHASVCFIEGDYTPKAVFHDQFPIRDWTKIVGAAGGKLDSIAWSEEIHEILEMDLFDITRVPRTLQRYKDESAEDPKEWSERLEFMASIRTSTSRTWTRGLTPFLCR